LKSTVIQVKNATVRFNIVSEKIDNIKEYFIKIVKKQLRFKEFLALKDINLEIKRGESWGIVGSNGAGKSTLLRLICGIIAPDKGSVRVNGSISPMLELGSGFDPQLTAAENIFIQGALLGYNRSFMKKNFDEIVAFSELQDFLEMPIKNYSSGMQARLAFAVSTVVNPDILIVDEVLSVGDAAFQRKCMNRMDEMLKGSTTLLLVSHSKDMIEQMCENAIWLRKGELVMAGKSEEVCDAYTKYYE
jgi:lipopolysaccharide transport system ATP-binding protein